MKAYSTLLYIITGCMVLSCARYLDVKPDLRLATPHTVYGLQSLLDNEMVFNQNYPAAAEIASDYYYLDDAAWQSVSVESDRQSYVWDPHTDRMNDWRIGYQAIFVANVVLENIQNADLEAANENDRGRVKGSAHFYRALRYLQLSQIFAPHYRPGINDEDWGLPLRTNPDINIPTSRNTLYETYGLIIEDLQTAARHLPDRATIPTRPSRASAYAALSRTFLILEEWELAHSFADSALQLQSALIDYNAIDGKSSTPFPIFNPEVLFHATILSSSALFMPSRAKVDSSLYELYYNNDIRKQAYFFSNDSVTFSFKGGYSGDGNAARSALLFAGLATDEVYLTKAEALARVGRELEALETLNALLVNRYQTDWKPYDIGNVSGENLLHLILTEREKTLVFRAGIRWGDLRRLNTDERFAKTLIRKIRGESFTLPPNDPRYVFLVPSEVVQLTEVPQNMR